MSFTYHMLSFTYYVISSTPHAVFYATWCLSHTTCCLSHITWYLPHTTWCLILHITCTKTRLMLFSYTDTHLTGKTNIEMDNVIYLCADMNDWKEFTTIIIVACCIYFCKQYHSIIAIHNRHIIRNIQIHFNMYHKEGTSFPSPLAI